MLSVYSKCFVCNYAIYTNKNNIASMQKFLEGKVPYEAIYLFARTKFSHFILDKLFKPKNNRISKLYISTAIIWRQVGYLHTESKTTFSQPFPLTGVVTTNESENDVIKRMNSLYCDNIPMRHCIVIT